jgi:hypothetical protein
VDERDINERNALSWFSMLPRRSVSPFFLLCRCASRRMRLSLSFDTKMTDDSTVPDSRVVRLVQDVLSFRHWRDEEVERELGGFDFERIGFDLASYFAWVWAAPTLDGSGAEGRERLVVFRSVGLEVVVIVDIVV